MTKIDGGTVLRRSMMSASEIAMGRFMRAPDDHTPAPAAGEVKAGDTPAPSPESVLFPKEIDPAAKPAGEVKQGEGDAPAEWKEFAPDPAKSDADNATAKAAHDATKPAEWKEYAPDPKKSDAENATAKAEHDKTKPAAKADAADADKVPDDGKYELAMPEGIELDKGLLDTVSPVFKDLNLTRAGAQKLTDAFIKAQTERATKQGETWGATVQGWADTAKADKEIGGTNWDGTVKASRSAVDRLGTPALKEYLEASGGGNHPELIRFMAKVGAMIKEDDPAGGDGGKGKPAEAAHVLFPNDVPKG